MRFPTFNKFATHTQWSAPNESGCNWMLMSLFLAAFFWPVTPWAATATYTYDQLNRLTSATIDGSRIEYTYDSAGNIEQVLTPYAVSATKSGDGFGNVSDDLDKLDCGDDCDGVYDLNTFVTLTATPDSGNAFNGWTGACTGSGACEIAVSGLVSVDALFVSAADEADLAITKTDGQTSVTPGDSTTYLIVVSNNGPSDVSDASVSDVFPVDLTCSYSSVASGGAAGNTASGVGNISDLLALPAGASVTYTAPCTISASPTGTISNTATVSSAVSDPVPGNDSATDDSTLVQSADLAISKTDNRETATPGSSTSYTIVVSNNGPSDVTGASVSDVFAADLTCTYTSMATGGASGNTAAGAGDISDSLGLPVGSSVTYTAPCNIAADATGTLSNTATVSSVASDPSPDNDSATDLTSLTSEADLSITKTDGQESVFAGRSTTYTIVVANAGPSAVSDALVTDSFPDELSCTYSSVSTIGASGNTVTGSSDISDVLMLPPGASVTYSAECDIASDTSGTISNTATVNSALSDLIPANNTATDNSEVQVLSDEIFLNGFEE